MNKKITLIILCLIALSSILFGLYRMAEYNEHSDNLKCYDKKGHVIQDLKCSGELNDGWGSCFIFIGMTCLFVVGLKAI